MHFEIYKDKAGEYRWRLVSLFGDEPKTIADSAEGYKNKTDLVHMIDRICICIGVREARIHDLTDQHNGQK